MFYVLYRNNEDFEEKHENMKNIDMKILLNNKNIILDSYLFEQLKLTNKNDLSFDDILKLFQLNMKFNKLSKNYFLKNIEILNKLNENDTFQTLLNINKQIINENKDLTLNMLKTHTMPCFNYCTNTYGSITNQGFVLKSKQFFKNSDHCKFVAFLAENFKVSKGQIMTFAIKLHKCIENKDAHKHFKHRGADEVYDYNGVGILCSYWHHTKLDPNGTYIDETIQRILNYNMPHGGLYHYSFCGGVNVDSNYYRYDWDAENPYECEKGDRIKVVINCVDWTITFYRNDKKVENKSFSIHKKVRNKRFYPFVYTCTCVDQEIEVCG